MRNGGWGHGRLPNDDPALCALRPRLTNDNDPSFQDIARRIGILIYPDFQLLDSTGPITTFEIAGYFSGEGYELAILSNAGGVVRSSSGAALASVAISEAGFVDTLIIIGGNGFGKAMDCPDTLAFLRDLSNSARRMCSVCSGAFPLAAAGVLDGRRATTHWRRAEDFARQFPGIMVEPDASYVRDGSVWTSAGTIAGIDLALAFVAED